MRILGALLCGLILGHPGVEAQQISVTPQAVFGAAIGRDAAIVPLGGFGLEVTRPGGSWDKSLGYRWIGIVRACDQRWPDACEVKTSGGHLLMAGISRVLRPGGARRVTLGGGVGGSHVHNDGTSSWETKAMVGVMASFRAPFDSGMLRLDGFLDWMPHATIIGVAVGIEAGF